MRDRLLSFQYHETDWVVIGSSPEEMINLGFTPVGRDFPVFLHPKTKEEYALARTEKKISVGHQGFEFYTCLLYTSPSPRDHQPSRMPSSA